MSWRRSLTRFCCSKGGAVAAVAAAAPVRGVSSWVGRPEETGTSGRGDYEAMGYCTSGARGQELGMEAWECAQCA